MQTFQKALIDKVLDGTIDRDVAANASSSRHDFMVALELAEKSQAAGLDHNLSASAMLDEPEPEEAAKPEPELSLRLAPLGD
jgi:hypothetical protein